MRRRLGEAALGADGRPGEPQRAGARGHAGPPRPRDQHRDRRGSLSEADVAVLRAVDAEAARQTERIARGADVGARLDAVDAENLVRLTPAELDDLSAHAADIRRRQAALESGKFSGRIRGVSAREAAPAERFDAAAAAAEARRAARERLAALTGEGTDDAADALSEAAQAAPTQAGGRVQPPAPAEAPRPRPEAEPSFGGSPPVREEAAASASAADIDATRPPRSPDAVTSPLPDPEASTVIDRPRPAQTGPVTLANRPPRDPDATLPPRNPDSTGAGPLPAPEATTIIDPPRPDRAEPTTLATRPPPRDPDATLPPRDPDARLPPSDPNATLPPRNPDATPPPREADVSAPREPDATLSQSPEVAHDAFRNAETQRLTAEDGASPTLNRQDPPAVSPAPERDVARLGDDASAARPAEPFDFGDPAQVETSRTSLFDSYSPTANGTSSRKLVLRGPDGSVRVGADGAPRRVTIAGRSRGGASNVVFELEGDDGGRVARFSAFPAGGVKNRVDQTGWDALESIDSDAVRVPAREGPFYVSSDDLGFSRLEDGAPSQLYRVELVERARPARSSSSWTTPAESRRRARRSRSTGRSGR